MSWTFQATSFDGKHSHVDVITGTHHCALAEVKEWEEDEDRRPIVGTRRTMKFGPPGLKGSVSVLWRFRVLEGPSKGAYFSYETPLAGHFESKQKKGHQIDASFLTKKVIEALDPTLNLAAGGEIDFRTYLKKEVEVTLQALTRKDGTPSSFPKIITIRPWFSAPSTPVLQVASSEPVEPYGIHQLHVDSNEDIPF